VTSTLSQGALIAAALRLGAPTISGWSAREAALARAAATTIDARTARRLRERIWGGEDPLGEAFSALRAPELRRPLGATYTPPVIVDAMLEWSRAHIAPERVVDPGTGSGRFLLRAAPVFPRAMLIGVEIDPLAAIIGRANLAAAGLVRRSHIALCDYRDFPSCDVAQAPGIARASARTRTLFIGNPPYVRHHLIETRWKDWLVRGWRSLGIRASRLAGLHVHFFLATLLAARPGDAGAFLTAAEWLDVNYGSALRAAFLGKLGGMGVVTLEPRACAFADAATTSAITLFRIGERASQIRFRRLKRIAGGMSLTYGARHAQDVRVSRHVLEREPRWSKLSAARPQSRTAATGNRMRSADLARQGDLVQLGELCRVHRGQATGANEVWIAGEEARDLPASVLIPTVTRARELISAGRVLGSLESLRRVVDLPRDLSDLEASQRPPVEAFLKAARRRGADRSYLARHRHAWWSVQLRAPAPILATYMARRPPVFTRNVAGARHLNIAHGLYPRVELSEAQLMGLVDYLSTRVRVEDGRTYAGGLTKFEPREMERLLVPRPDALSA